MFDQSHAAVRVSACTLAADIFLALLKLGAALLSGSSALLSDALHSAADVLSSFAVLLGVKLSHRAPDFRHPYGHEKLESLTSLALSALLLTAGITIGTNGIRTIFSVSAGNAAVPGGIALYAALIAMSVKEGMYWYTRAVALRINSTVLHASAWHHRTDALSSLGSFVGVLGARMGFPLLDPIMSLVICLLILHIALRIGAGAITGLIDCACPPDTEAKMRNLILSQSGVLSLDSLRTRLCGNRICLDVRIGAEGGQSLTSAHAIASSVRRSLETAFPEIKSCIIHVNPREL